MKPPKKLNWKKMKGRLPAVVQDAKTGAVLMVGYMNRAALVKTCSTRRAWFDSRSKKRLWMKGEASGNVLEVRAVRADCDGDALLILVHPQGPTCHTGAFSCFGDAGTFDRALQDLAEVIASRKKKRPDGSYTALLFRKGLKKILAKVAEEGREVVKAGRQETRKRLIEESVDVLYHLMVLWAARGVTPEAVTREIRRRRG